MMSVFLLQSSNFYETNTNWVLLVITLIVIVGIFVVISITGRFVGINRIRSNFNKRTFRTQAAAIGLTKLQTKTLEHLIPIYHVHRPYQLLSNPNLLQTTLGKAMRDFKIKKGKAESIETQKLNMYKILQKVELQSSASGSNVATSQLLPGHPVILQLPEGGRIKTIITANINDFYCIQAPKTNLPLQKGRMVKILVSFEDKKELMFQSRVLGKTKIKNIQSFMLRHTVSISSTGQRKLRRVPTSVKCTFAPMMTHKGKPVVMKQDTTTGLIIEISSGGCTLMTAKILQVGELIALSFNLEQESKINLVGKIVNRRFDVSRQVTFHVMFTRASAANLNKINAFVYNME